MNLTGGFNMARAALPEIRKATGALVFTGSVQSHATQGNVAAYTAAKHGLYGLVQSIAVDFRARGCEGRTSWRRGSVRDADAGMGGGAVGRSGVGLAGAGRDASHGKDRGARGGGGG